MMPQELTEQFVGMKAGDEKEFDFTTEFDTDLAGKTIHTTATVKEVREKENARARRRVREEGRFR